MAIVANLVMDQGSTFSANINVTDASGNALNLTGFSVASQMRKSYASTTSTAFTATINNAAGGGITIALPAATTNNLKAGMYVYDVEITASDSTVTRVIEGQIEVTPGVTR